MKTVALISGGKDSCYNMMQCVAEGHELVALANLKPDKEDELDSYMYQTVGHHAIDLYAQAMGLPLLRRTIQGGSKLTDRDYVPTTDDEVEDLYQLLLEVKEQFQIEAVSVGAILSDYQRVRVENVCQRIGLTSLGYLWRRDQTELLNEMIQCGVDAILIKVASLGLSPKKHLGKSLKAMQSELMDIHKKYELNVCGEGGEYETFTVDCPLFNKKIILDKIETVVHSDDPIAPVGYLNLKEAHLQDKDMDPNIPMIARLKNLPMKRSSDVMKEILIDEFAPCLDFYANSSVEFSCKSETLSDEVKPKIKHSSDDVWIAGLTGKYSASKSLQEITKAMMDQLKDMVENLGELWSMGSLVYVHLYVQNMADFAEINSVYKTYFSINPPARVCVQAQLPEDVALQIDCYGNCRKELRQTMHVQGMSHWAPANIGPYSQCVKVDNRLYVAGQIPLIPGSMVILDKGIQAEARLALRHVSHVLAAVHSGCNISHTDSVVCYVTHPEYVEVARFEWKKYLSNYYRTESELLQNSPGVMYVVVPTLPRGASIEWQVVATIGGSHRVDTNRQSEINDPHTPNMSEKPQELASLPKYKARMSRLGWYCKSCEMDKEETSKRFLSFSLYMYSYTKSPSTMEVARSLATEIREGLSVVGGDVCLPLLRVFFRAAALDYNQVHHDLDENLRKAVGQEVVFSLVPVHGFKEDNDNSIIQVCC